MSYDLAIIGAGPGGYVAAIRAAQLGAKVALIERDRVGGVCLNRGCIPTKAMIASAHALDAARRAADFGVTTPFPLPSGGEPACRQAGARVRGGPPLPVGMRGGEGVGGIDFAIDLAKVHARKDRIVAELRGGIEKLLKGNRIELIAGTAAFTGPGKLSVDGTSLDAKRILIATGSAWIELPDLATDGTAIVTTDEALEWTEVPGRLAIVGGGVIGCEFACMMRAFGAEVTIVEATPSILPPVEKAVSRLLARAMKARGIEILTGTTVSPSPLRGEPACRQAGVGVRGGGVTFTLSTGEERMADRMIVAVGRRPLTAGLGLESAGIELTERGFIKVDGRFQTTAENIFAIGDVIGPPMLAHAASAEGIAAVHGMFESPLTHPSPQRGEEGTLASVPSPLRGEEGTLASVPSPLRGEGQGEGWCPSPIFTSPEIASIGATSEELTAKGIAFTTGRFPFAANGKALCDGEPEGQAIVHADPGGRLLGVHLIGAGATTMIAEAALALKKGLTVADIAATIHAHPTLPEAMAEACEDTMGRAIHKGRTLVR